MATITSEIVNEYFSKRNLEHFGNFVIPQHLNTVDAKRWLAKIDRISNVPVGTQMFELSWGDYYKFTMNQFMKHHD